MGLRKNLGLILLLLVVLSTSRLAQASTMESQVMDVEILDDGSAIIKEQRQMDISSGTEVYINLENLESGQIAYFKVFENGVEFESLDYWNLDASREDKAGKSGVIPKSPRGYELAWGFGDYGPHTFQLEYKVNGFIEDLTDGQVFYYRFVNDQMTPMPDHVEISLRAQDGRGIGQLATGFWGFGYEGYTEIYSDHLLAYSSEPLGSSNHMTLLASFEAGTFATYKTKSESLEELKKEAFEGSSFSLEDPGQGGTSSTGTLGLGAISAISIIAGSWALISLVAAVLIVAYVRSRPKTYFFDGSPYRDLPYDGDILDLTYLQPYFRTSNDNLMTMLILKWIYEGKIKSTKTEAGKIFKREETSLILDLTASFHPEAGLEQELYQKFIEASGGDGILNEGDLSSYSSDNYKKLSYWREQAFKASEEKLDSLGCLSLEYRRLWGLKLSDRELTEKGQALVSKLLGFKNYLEQYSLLAEREDVSVHLWDQYMIWAAFFGITKTVEKQFASIYPNYQTESAYRGGMIAISTSFSQSMSPSSSSSSSGGGSSGFSGGGSGGGVR